MNNASSAPNARADLAFYRDLKTYRQHPTSQRKVALRHVTASTRKTGFVTLDVCSHSSMPTSTNADSPRSARIPLHTNDRRTTSATSHQAKVSSAQGAHRRDSVSLPQPQQCKTQLRLLRLPQLTPSTNQPELPTSNIHHHPTQPHFPLTQHSLYSSITPPSPQPRANHQSPSCTYLLHQRICIELPALARDSFGHFGPRRNRTDLFYAPVEGESDTAATRRQPLMN